MSELSKQGGQGNPRRYYQADSTVDKQAPTQAMTQALHAAYTHWVRANCHRRDFRCAVEHVAQLLMCDFFMEVKSSSGSCPPESPSQNVPFTPPSLARAVPLRTKPSQPQRRFYDELCTIAPEVDLSALETVLPPFFHHWRAEGWLARDFVAAACDAAAVVVYDHELSMSVGGLGGGKTEEDFLTLPYQG